MINLEGFISNDRFASHNGIEIVDHGKGHAKARVVISPEHLNSAGIVHGALIFALADTAFSAASRLIVIAPPSLTSDGR